MAASLQHARPAVARFHLPHRGVLSLRRTSLVRSLANTQILPTSPSDPPRADDVALVSTSQTHYLRGKRAERMRARGKMQMTVAMQGGGVAGLSQLRAKLSGKSYDHAAGYERLSASSMEEGAGGSLSRGNLKRTGSGSSFGSGGSLLESVRYLEQQKGGGGSR